MAAENFNRLVVVQFNDQEYRSRPEPGFRIDADVTLKRGTLPKMTLKIYNIGREQESSILNADRKSLRVRLLAGYEEDPNANPPLVFDGNILRNGGTLQKGETDRVLKIECKEGAIAFSKTVNIAFGKEATGGDVISAFLKEVSNSNPILDAGIEAGAYFLGEAADLVGEEISNRVADGAEALKIGALSANAVFQKALPPGISFSGNARDVKREIEESLGVEMPVTRGYIEVYERRKPRIRQGPLISYELGNLLKAPEPKSNNKIQFTALLVPQLAPGDRFELVTLDNNDSGIYVCLEHTMSISSGYSNQFYSKVVARRDA